VFSLSRRTRLAAACLRYQNGSGISGIFPKILWVNTRLSLEIWEILQRGAAGLVRRNGQRLTRPSESVPELASPRVQLAAIDELRQYGVMRNTVRDFVYG
jgi:hypothetical protein